MNDTHRLPDAIDCRRADRGLHERQLAVARPCAVGQVVGSWSTSPSISRPWMRRSNTQRAVASYFCNTGSPVWKTKKKPPAGSTSGMPLFSAR